MFTHASISFLNITLPDFGIFQLVNTYGTTVQFKMAVRSLYVYLCTAGIEGLFLSGDAVLDHLLTDLFKPLLHFFQLRT